MAHVPTVLVSILMNSSPKWTFHPTKITWETQALACFPQISPHLYPPQLFTWNQIISCSQLPGAYFQVNHVKHLGKRVKFPGIEPLPNTPRFTPRQWQSIPLLPACDWKTKPPQRWGFGGFAIITCLDLPRGAEWMIRAAYTPSLRVQNSTLWCLWWNNPKKLGETLKSPRDLLPTDTNL